MKSYLFSSLKENQRLSICLPQDLTLAKSRLTTSNQELQNSGLKSFKPFTPILKRHPYNPSRVDSQNVLPNSSLTPNLFSIPVVIDKVLEKHSVHSPKYVMGTSSRAVGIYSILIECGKFVNMAKEQARQSTYLNQNVTWFETPGTGSSYFSTG